MMPWPANGFANGSTDSLGEDVADANGVLTQDVRVNPQCHGRIGMPEPGSYDVDGNTSKK
jgi:hypothetical protein